jgi:MFS family permease
MQLNTSVDIPHVIQLAIAPVFLLSGIATTLGVLTTRLGRIIDRARLLEAQLPETTGTTHEIAVAELATLSRRAHLVNRGITLCTAAALFVCLLIGCLFLGSLLNRALVWLLAGLFIGSMVALIGGYISFLQEILTATHSLRFGRKRG